MLIGILFYIYIRCLCWTDCIY